MGKNMCPSCGLRALKEMNDLASNQRKFWVDMEEDLEAQIDKEEDKLEKYFRELGYESE